MTISTGQRGRRRDAYPEFQGWEDCGCSLEPACLTCSRPRCRYDEASAARAVAREASAVRNREIVSRHQRGMPYARLAREYGLSRRRVTDICQEQGV